jgi:hypothetical protein
VSAALAQVYDEANLRPILRAYLPPELSIHSQTHSIDDDLVTLVHVEPGPSGPLTLIADGEYTGRRGKREFVFEAGQRYIRDGTSNALWTGDQHQVHLLVTRRATESGPGASVSDETLADAVQNFLRDRRAEGIASQIAPTRTTAVYSASSYVRTRNASCSGASRARRGRSGFASSSIVTGGTRRTRPGARSGPSSGAFSVGASRQIVC